MYLLLLLLVPKVLSLDMDCSMRINIKVCGYDGLTAVLKPYSNFGLTMALITVSATSPSLENYHISVPGR